MMYRKNKSISRLFYRLIYELDISVSIKQHKNAKFLIYAYSFRYTYENIIQNYPFKNDKVKNKNMFC